MELKCKGNNEINRHPIKPFFDTQFEKGHNSFLVGSRGSHADALCITTFN